MPPISRDLQDSETMRKIKWRMLGWTVTQTFLNDDKRWEFIFLDEKAQQCTSASGAPGVFVWGYLILVFGSFFIVGESNSILINYNRHVPEWRVKKNKRLRNVDWFRQPIMLYSRRKDSWWINVLRSLKVLSLYHALLSPQKLREHRRRASRKQGGAGGWKGELWDRTALVQALISLCKICVRASQPGLQHWWGRNMLDRWFSTCGLQLSGQTSTSKNIYVMINKSSKITVRKKQQKWFYGWGEHNMRSYIKGLQP